MWERIKEMCWYSKSGFCCGAVMSSVFYNLPDVCCQNVLDSNVVISGQLVLFCCQNLFANNERIQALRVQRHGCESVDMPARDRHPLTHVSKQKYMLMWVNVTNQYYIHEEILTFC